MKDFQAHAPSRHGMAARQVFKAKMQQRLLICRLKAQPGQTEAFENFHSPWLNIPLSMQKCLG